jgi:hypothetical protein
MTIVLIVEDDFPASELQTLLKTAMTSADQQDREQRALDLRSEGRTFKEIGAQLGCKTYTARMLVMAGERRRRALNVLAQRPEDLRALADLGRLRPATFNAIFNLGVRLERRFERISDLARISEWHLKVTTGLGPSGRAEIKWLMQSFGVELSPSPPPLRIRRQYGPS